MDEHTLSGSLFVLKSSTIDNDNFINNDSVVKIISCMNNYYLSSVKQKSGEEEEEEEGAETQDSAAEDLEMLMDERGGQGMDNDIERQIGDGKLDAKVYTPMNKEEFDFLRNQTIMLRRNHKEEDVFIMKKAEQQEISDVLFIHSCVDAIKLYLYNVRRKLTENLSVSYFVQLEELLTSMIFFITETESLDPFTCEGIPYKKR